MEILTAEELSRIILLSQSGPLAERWDSERTGDDLLIEKLERMQLQARAAQLSAELPIVQRIKVALQQAERNSVQTIPREDGIAFRFVDGSVLEIDIRVDEKSKTVLTSHHTSFGHAKTPS